MSGIIVSQPQADLVRWAAENMGYPDFRFRPDAKAIGHVRAGALAAVVVFDNFSDGDCMISVVSDGGRRWFSREFGRAVVAYPFVQLGQRRLTAMILESNAASRAFCAAFGFTQEGRLRKAGPGGEDMLLFGMLREECRWL